MLRTAAAFLSLGLSVGCSAEPVTGLFAETNLPGSMRLAESEPHTEELCAAYQKRAAELLDPEKEALALCRALIGLGDRTCEEAEASCYADAPELSEEPHFSNRCPAVLVRVSTCPELTLEELSSCQEALLQYLANDLLEASCSNISAVLDLRTAECEGLADRCPYSAVIETTGWD